MMQIAICVREQRLEQLKQNNHVLFEKSDVANVKKVIKIKQDRMMESQDAYIYTRTGH